VLLGPDKSGKGRENTQRSRNETTCRTFSGEVYGISYAKSNKNLFRLVRFIGQDLIRRLSDTEQNHLVEDRV
jgi:hypothetical protein